ncbi:glycine-rich cell wall structural protein 1-like [Beta vulgaris subsp. vulgaris]|uniref:glycine-rich cell wall structural protein 1-like n=1 Tax=Beta vulgaris subsp. vulgaris TaxID=3555 RepID=UPI002546995C|nr:glycine-rich cell wall structural protein 1-like [Beta vulgaris subsp. vulgaris]
MSFKDLERALPGLPAVFRFRGCEVEGGVAAELDGPECGGRRGDGGGFDFGTECVADLVVGFRTKGFVAGGLEAKVLKRPFVKVGGFGEFVVDGGVGCGGGGGGDGGGEGGGVSDGGGVGMRGREDEGDGVGEERRFFLRNRRATIFLPMVEHLQVKVERRWKVF